MAATVGDEPTPPAQDGGEHSAAAPPAVRVRVGELVSAVSAIGLLVLLLAAKWYGVAGVPDPSYARPAISTAENGWDGLTVTRWVVLATIVAALGSVLLHVSQREHGVKTDTGRVVTAFGAVASALLVYRVLIALPGGQVIDQKLGAVLAVGCAVGIAAGGVESIGEERQRARHAAGRSHRRSRLTPRRLTR
ncbi:MAG: hypothetical protein ABSH51_24405 [Solirubrobacteraceae bacterium]|jgi:hypothetical protein